jgi:RNA polymerase sigma factor (sigma-70 family)
MKIQLNHKGAKGTKAVFLEEEQHMDSYEALIKTVQHTHGEARHEAFSELMNRFKAAAYRWALNLLGDEHLAQDAAQEAFIAAYDHIDQLRDPAAFPGWLKQIVLSRCNRLTRRKQFSTSDYEDELTYADPSSGVEERDLRQQVIEALNGLPEHERAVTELFYVAGYSQREIAEQLQVPITTVKKRLQYAREHLRAAVIPMNSVLSAIGFDTPEARESYLDALLRQWFQGALITPLYQHFQPMMSGGL